MEGSIKIQFIAKSMLSCDRWSHRKPSHHHDLGFFFGLSARPGLFLGLNRSALPSYMLMVKTTEYDGSQPVSSGKRKKGDEDAISSMVSKKQRTRVRYGSLNRFLRPGSVNMSSSFSCGECHRRKQKVFLRTCSQFFPLH